LNAMRMRGAQQHGEQMRGTSPVWHWRD
jgi:hypothetical protein